MGVLSIASSVGGCLLDLFYPADCQGCGCTLWGSHGAALCGECEQKIRYHDNSGCTFCGTAAGDFAVLGHGCSRCRPSVQQFTRATGAVRYLEPAREMVHNFKYLQETSLAQPFAESMLQRLEESEFPKTFDSVVPVPLHPKRHRWRGYNQSELLAHNISDSNGWPLLIKTLRRVKNTTAQALLLPLERKENIKGAFTAPEGSFTGQTVLLVDDVMTTGHTVSECAGVLRGAGAKHVYVLVFAR